MRERERDEESMREREMGEIVGERKREAVKERERERGGSEREREKDESMRIGKDRKSP